MNLVLENIPEGPCVPSLRTSLLPTRSLIRKIIDCSRFSWICPQIDVAFPNLLIFCLFKMRPGFSWIIMQMKSSAGFIIFSLTTNMALEMQLLDCVCWKLCENYEIKRRCFTKKSVLSRCLVDRTICPETKNKIANLQTRDMWVNSAKWKSNLMSNLSTWSLRTNILGSSVSAMTVDLVLKHSGFVKCMCEMNSFAPF